MKASSRAKLHVGSGSRVVGSKTISSLPVRTSEVRRCYDYYSVSWVGVAAGTKPSHHLSFLRSDTSFYRRVCRHAVCLFSRKYSGNLCRRTEELNLHCAVIGARCRACRLDSRHMTKPIPATGWHIGTGEILCVIKALQQQQPLRRNFPASVPLF